MKKFVKTLGFASLAITGSAVMMTSAMADSTTYQGNAKGKAYGHVGRTTTTTTATTTNASPVTSSRGQYNYRSQNNQSNSGNQYGRNNRYNNGNHYGQYNNRVNYGNNGNHYGQYNQTNQTRYASQPQVINGRPQYNYRNTYPTRPAYPAYDRARDYRYGYTSRPQWYGRMHPNEYNVLRRDGRDYYYLQPNIYSTGVVIGRPQPGVVLMQYPDRTLEVIEATRLILDVMYRR